MFMKKRNSFSAIKWCPLVLSVLLLLSGCGWGGSPDSGFEIELELTKDYDDSDPFINERLFDVTEDVDILELDISLELEGDGGVLEIADNGSGEVLWSRQWKDSTEKTDFAVSLPSLKKEKEYLIRLTGTDIAYAKAVVKSDSMMVKERARPAKASQ